MIENPLTIAPFYKGWDEYQQRLVQAVAPLTLEQLALGVAQRLRWDARSPRSGGGTR